MGKPISFTKTLNGSKSYCFRAEKEKHGKKGSKGIVLFFYELFFTFLKASHWPWYNSLSDFEVYQEKKLTKFLFLGKMLI